MRATRSATMRTVAVLLLFYLCLHREGASQECVNGLMAAESVRQLGRVAGARTNDRNNQQRIVPEISFGCSGRVTKWIIAGRYYVLFRPDRFPEMQIWRETANSSGVYTKISGRTQSVTGQFSQIYEYTIDPVDVQSGDVLGIFQPANSRLELYYTDQYGPVNYYMNTGSAVAPPTGDFGISGADGMMNDMPLVTVEITPTDGSSASDCVRNFASMDAIEIGIQQVTFGTFVAVVNDEEQQQRIIPAINFTCHGFITKWIFAAMWDNTDNLPELQTWNSTDGTTYKKQGATTVSLEGGSAEMTYYEYSPNPPHEFNDGDVLGMFIPDETRLALFFERVDSGSLNIVYDTGSGIVSPPVGDLIATNGDREVNAAPLIAVEVSIPQPEIRMTTLLPSPSHVDGVGPSTTVREFESSSATLSASRTDIDITSVNVQSTMVPMPRPSLDDSSSSSTVSVGKPTTVLVGGTSAVYVESPTADTPGTTDGGGSSSDPSEPLGAIAGAIIAVLIVLILAGIIGVAIVVLVIRRRNKEYDLQRQEDGMTNPVYDGTTVKFGRHQESEEGDVDVLYQIPEGAIYDDAEPLPYMEPAASLSDLLTQSYCVPTEGQRKYGSTQNIYATLTNTSEENYFPESEIYWAPASNQSDLYAQLAQNKFREIPRHFVRVCEHLGTGNFGQVNKGVWESPSGSMEVAVKALRPGASEIDRVKFLQEAAIMGQFHHPNVIALHGVVTVVDPVMIVLELMSHGDLKQYLVHLQPIPGEMVPSNTSQMCLDFCCQIASGMEYLSKKAFVHRDLAARNILVSDQRTCKIADFGMARDLEEGNYYVSHGGKIPVKWTAPEAINYKKYSTASDVWSYGALMYEIWSLGHKPFEGYTNMQTINLVNGGWRLPPPPGCSKAVYKLMVSCWHPLAGSRPSFSDLLQSLSRPETELLHWTEEDTKTHPQAAVLGAPLEAGKDLYPDLQDIYMDT